MVSDERVLEAARLVREKGELEAISILGINAESLSRYLRRARSISDFKDDPKETNVKVLIFDIETAPTLGYVWRRWKNNLSQDMVVREGYVLCYAAKWLGEEEIMVDALPFYNNYERNKEDDRDVCSSLYELFNQADIVIGHNGKAFDVPLMKTRFLHHGFEPPKPYKEIDTKLIAKKEFMFPSNSLDSLGSYLGLGRKVEHDGFPLWVGCMSGNKESWDKMIEYNEGDVSLLEKIYLKMRPWYRQHPAMDVYSKSGVMRCKCCGSTNLSEGDIVYTNISGFTSYKCNDCGHWNRGRKNQRSKEQMQTTLMNVY